MKSLRLEIKRKVVATINGQNEWMLVANTIYPFTEGRCHNGCH
jgi:hypothetical protein